MLNVKLIVLGNLKEKYLREAQSEYVKRLSAFCNLKIIELSEVKTGESQALVEKALKKEAQMIKSAIGDSFAIPLCIEGAKMSSEKLSKFIQEKTVTGCSSIAFIIGSSFGLDSEIKKMGKTLSVSDMTFPHQLFRIMLLEQIYRAFMIEKGTKYHK